jgi:putative ATP-dependent endonuclease of OLD family
MVSSYYYDGKTAEKDNNSIITRYNGYTYEPEEEWLCKEKSQNYTSREELNKTPLKEYLPPTGKINKKDIEDAQLKYIENFKPQLKFQRKLETGFLLGSKNVAGGILPDFYIIPAICDLTDETKIKTTTVFGRLLTRAVKEMAERDERFKDLNKKIDELIQSLNRTEDELDSRPKQLDELEKVIKDELSNWNVDVEIEVIPPDVEKFFELGTNLHLDDGIKTLAEYKGHGLQRAVIIALFKAWSKVLHMGELQEGTEENKRRASSESVFFAIEEPELFLHPHAQRNLSYSLKDLAKNQEYQIFICSHSPFFIDLENYKNICVVTKNQNTGTKVNQCRKNLFQGEDFKERKKRFHMAHWINPDRGEMFFAERVIFVEGETEKVVFPYLADKLECINHEISIIDCGSKFNIPMYIEIANAFKIPYLVVHDEDPIPEKLPDKEDIRNSLINTYILNEKINNLIDETFGDVEMLSPDFEKLSGISKTQSEKKGKSFAAIEHFSNKKESEIPERLVKIVKKIYC